jgi:hypothetical protein
MNTAAEVLECQRQLGDAAGNRKVAAWMIAASIVLLAGGVVEAIKAGEAVWRVLPVPLLLLTQSMFMRAEASRRQRELAERLG